ncbi:MAG TPA: hypothetical protein P5234_06835 [Thermoanaerobaculaceae bacterium]|nr:hypothetical protein [Thermoanaerobaculaceae bacterium]HRS15951.1 hypothetical protein [Thermoanaerobaculaceae bacterium]
MHEATHGGCGSEKAWSVFFAGRPLRQAERPLPGRHGIAVVDVMEEYPVALANGILVVPTLVVDRPGTRVIVDSTRDEATVLAALGLAARDGRPG